MDLAINNMTPTPEATKIPQTRDLSLSGNVLVITNKAQPVMGLLNEELNMEVTKRKIADSITWGESGTEFSTVSQNNFILGEYYLPLMISILQCSL